MHRITLALLRGRYAKVDATSAQDAPRTHVFDSAFESVLDESCLDQGPVARALPVWWNLAREVLDRTSRSDGFVSWGERLTLALLLQQRLRRSGGRHIAMMYQFEKPNLRIPLHLLKENLHGVVTWSSVQRRALIDRIGYPAEKVFLVRHYVDELFFSPREAEGDMICGVGAEMRDYATLVRAIQGTGIRCHIATDHVRIRRAWRFLPDRRVEIDGIVPTKREPLVTSGGLTLTMLRDLYARSMFVVIPLLPSDTDNGVTCILQAMAMGKPVICSKTRGQVDVIEEGKTGLYVPVGDADALRAAILSLWKNPERARQMGQNARAYVERYHTLDGFTAAVRSAAEACLDGRPAPETWWE